VDRLDRIKAWLARCQERHQWPTDPDDLYWLIAEVERLRRIERAVRQVRELSSDPRLGGFVFQAALAALDRALAGEPDPEPQGEIGEWPGGLVIRETRED
jgi:hypothetical protein